MDYYHVDVFSAKPFSGNGLTVVFLNKSLAATSLLAIAQEFKQFETIFLAAPNADGNYPARIFTMDEELSFAGHPILGAGAVVHQTSFYNKEDVSFSFMLETRRVNVRSQKKDAHYQVTMNQGSATFINTVNVSFYGEIAEALGLQKTDIDFSYPMEVVSTGLPYLLVPLKNGLSTSCIKHNNFEAFLERFSAKFVYVFDTKTLECRTWDNHANNEDVATGSAAGPLCAYLVKNRFKQSNEIIKIHQGKYVNRPSIIRGWMTRDDIGNENVYIAGEVSFFSSGKIDVDPF